MKITRRSLLKATGATVGALPVLAEGDAGAERSTTEVAPDERVHVSLRVNGTTHALDVAPLETLASTLRERLALTGTKTSCEAGACGACTVHIDGAPRASCLTLTLDAEGANVRTIEALAGDGLDPLQQAFVDADALQCGFCTPGMIMSARAFVTTWASMRPGEEPSDDDVARAMSGNLCRCGAYPQIFEAVRATCAGRPARRPGAHTTGLSLSRHDTREKVTGRARYTVDEQLPGMHVGVVVRARVASARVTRIELEAARAMPGVSAAITMLPLDARGHGRVRYVGQELAAISARSRDEALLAARAVVVELEPLPLVVDPVLAAREGAPLVWDDADDAPNAGEAPLPPAFVMGWQGNVRTGLLGNFFVDSEGALAEASSSDVHVRLVAKTASQSHASLERHAAIAHFDGDALTLFTGTQTVQSLASDLAAALGVPSSSVTVLSPYVGGAFGSKAGLKPYHLAAARLARAAGAPVKIVLAPDEHLTNGGNRPATAHVVDIGAERDGTLIAVHHDARSSCGIAVGESASGMTAKHYAWKTTAIVDTNVVTHTPPASPFRAPGYPPNAFALEQAIDEVALRTRRNPLELRLAQEGRRRFRMVYRAALERSGLASRMTDVAVDKGRFARGVGVATAEWFVLTSPSTVVEVRAMKDGHVEIATATHDLGQGARSVLANLVRSRLRLDAAHIAVKVGDSRLTTASGTFGSITTTSIAPAAEKALVALEDALFERARGVMGGGRRTEAGLVDDNDVLHPWSSLFALLPHEPFVTTGRRGTDRGGFDLPPRAFDPIVHLSPFAYAKDEVSSAIVVEAEVDRRLGRVRPIMAFIALDAGRLASPVTAHTQVTGAVIQGLAYALYEERRFDGTTGHLLTSSLDGYALPGIADAPRIDVAFLDAASDHNPSGVLGLGENSTIASSAALANAVARALGRRVSTTPLTPERVMEALR